MKATKCLLALPLAVLVLSCSMGEEEIANGSDVKYPSEVYARIDAKGQTRVNADENLKVLWGKDDRISLFNKYTYNKEYKFSGETGANSGKFEEVSSGEIVTGNSLDNVYAVYLYQERTVISNYGVITLDLPAEQSYKANSFGLGANTLTGFRLLNRYSVPQPPAQVSVRRRSGLFLFPQTHHRWLQENDIPGNRILSAT